MNKDEIIKKRYPHYDPMVWRDDVELNSEQIKVLMDDLIDVIVGFYVPDGNPEVWLRKIQDLRDYNSVDKKVPGVVNATLKQLASIGITDVPENAPVEVYNIDQYETVYGDGSMMVYKYNNLDYIIPTSWIKFT